ncbi:hypothetical protein WME94_21430 [Sorangium sp. So ce429]
MREDLEEHPARQRRQAEPVEKRPRRLRVELAVGAFAVEGKHLQAPAEAHAKKVPKPDRARAREQGEDVQRRLVGQPSDGFSRASGAEERIVGERREQAARGVDAREQRSQVVILTKERVARALLEAA